MKTRITELFNIKYPIVQGGMIWCSDWHLASAVSEAGGLGLIGAGSMYPEQLIENIQKAKAATTKPFGVNLPLIYPQIEEHIKIIVENKVPIVFTSAGNPKKYTSYFKEQGIKVVHVVANVKFAMKAAEAGVDAIVAEGYEAGGHNGLDEITTMALIPQVVANVDIPVIAAGGIATGSGLLAALSLGAEGVQMGTLFVASEESSAHPKFKQTVINAADTDTMVTLKKVIPVRLIKNDFFQKVKELEDKGATREELDELLGKARAKKGMAEGDLIEGELEIGQISGIINEIKPVKHIITDIINEFNETKKRICKF